MRSLSLGVPRARDLQRLGAHAGTQLLLAIAAYISPVLAREAPERGAFVLLRGADTMAVDRFIRTADTLRGSLEVRGEEARLDYLALLSAGETVRSLQMEVFAVPGSADDAPLQSIRVLVQGDTMLVERESGVQRVATTAGAIPMFAHAWALTELFTRRARMTDGTTDVPFFAVSGDVTLNVTLRPVGTDSLVMTMSGEDTRLHVDAVGRILGGMVPGTSFELLRGGG